MRPAAIDIPHPLPEGWEWVDWNHGKWPELAAAWKLIDGENKYAIWTYNPKLIKQTSGEVLGGNPDPNLWRVRIEGNVFLGCFDTFDAACLYISNYMMLGMHNEIS